MPQANEQNELTAQFKARVDTLFEESGRLDATLGSDLRKLLSTTRNRLNEIETFALDPKILAERRSSERLAHWFANWEPFLRSVEQEIAQVEALRRDFGPDAKVVV